MVKIGAIGGAAELRRCVTTENWLRTRCKRDTSCGHIIHHKVGITRSDCKRTSTGTHWSHSLLVLHLRMGHVSIGMHRRNPYAYHQISQATYHKVSPGITRHHKASQGRHHKVRLRTSGVHILGGHPVFFDSALRASVQFAPPLTPLTSPYWRATRLAEPSRLQRRRSQKAFEAQVHIGELPSLRAALR